jgi:hypothetical protein
MFGSLHPIDFGVGKSNGGFPTAGVRTGGEDDRNPGAIAI